MNALYEKYTRRYPSLIGQRFGKLTVCDIDGSKDGQICWICLCDCSVFTSVRTAALMSGKTQSCGCQQGGHLITHGHLRHGKLPREYQSWNRAKTRCYNPNVPKYKDYGARGIKMCDRWLNSYEDFLADMGPCPEGKSLDRYPNNDGNYEPGNCRWATRFEQANNRRNNRVLTVSGVSKTLQQWSNELGLDPETVSDRLKKGLPPELALAQRNYENHEIKKLLRKK